MDLRLKCNVFELRQTAVLLKKASVFVRRHIFKTLLIVRVYKFGEDCMTHHNVHKFEIMNYH